MAIGTAGFTAMLSVLTLEHGGRVSRHGASGRRRLDRNRPSFGGRLPRRRVHRQGFGGAISERSRSSDDPRQGDAERRRSGDLAERWAGAIDAVGGRSLASILAQTSHSGVVTTCGFVGEGDLLASVLPFILRGVMLAGIDSLRAPRSMREMAWQRLPIRYEGTN